MAASFSNMFILPVSIYHQNESYRNKGLEPDGFGKNSPLNHYTTHLTFTKNIIICLISKLRIRQLWMNTLQSTGILTTV